MNAIYKRVNNAIGFTLDFYNQSFFHSYVGHLENKLSGLNGWIFFDNIEDRTNRIYALMEDEIKQVIYTHHKVARNQFFEYLKLWLIPEKGLSQLNNNLIDECIQKELKSSNEEVIKQYIFIAKNTIDKFKKIVEHYIGMYDSGKLEESTQNIIIQFPQLPTYTETKQLQNSAPIKLKTNLNIHQFTYLFKLLNNLNPAIFKLNSQTDLYSFLAQSFSTKQAENITIDSIKNKMLVPEKESAKFWVNHLKTMLEQARKE